MGPARPPKYDGFATFALTVLHAFVKRVSCLGLRPCFRKYVAARWGSPTMREPVKGSRVSNPKRKRMRLETTMRAKRKLPEDYRPSENEPFMSERQRAYFRRKLLSWRNEILRSTKETLKHLHDDSAQHADIADRATSETERALELFAPDRPRKLED